MPLAPKSGTATPVFAALAMLATLVGASRAPGDTVRMKNGLSYRGTVDRDNTLIQVFDGIRRVVVRDSKIRRPIESDASFRNLETFRLVQPLEVHGGTMPDFALNVRATEWDEFGRRRFGCVGVNGRGKSESIRMTQALIELGPHLVRLRGVDGFWQGQLDTDQVPRPVVLGLLHKVERTNRNERMRVARFLIQAEWYAEALAELDELRADFPELAETVEGVRESVRALQARALRDEIEGARKAQQPRTVLSRLRGFPVEGAPEDLLKEVRAAALAAEDRSAADVALARDLRATADRLPEEARAAWAEALVEMLRALEEAPDAARDRLKAFAEADPAADAPAERFARAASGWVLGAEAAAADLDAAARLWETRGLIQEYLVTTADADAARADLLGRMRAMSWTVGGEPQALDPALATRIVRRLPPPLGQGEVKPGKVTICRVRDDPNEVPTEYGVLLPPEYHPLRSYPTVVALHPGQGETSLARMRGAISWWADEARRRGYIVIAPEYNLPGRPPDYRYSPSEHAAVELALRDARKRFAVDPDRTFLGGQLLGGHMAWDFGLAHPDLFAGVAVVSGLPAKYVDRYRDHAAMVPMYVALGDMAPGATEVIFDLVKALILKTYDVTYVEYYRRGLEDLPEEVGPIFDWMDHHPDRDPAPKSFAAATARTCDNRFWGVVVRDDGFAPGRAADVGEVEVDPLGKSLKPATISWKTSTPANLINLRVDGLRKLDLWISPEVADFSRKLEVRINGRPYYRGLPKPDLGALLEDLRLRGDCRQVYWMKVPAG